MTSYIDRTLNSHTLVMPLLFKLKILQQDVTVEEVK